MKRRNKQGCATSKQGLANWLLMLAKRGRRIAPGSEWSWPNGNAERYDRDRFPNGRLPMTTQTHPGFLQTATGQMTILAVMAIVVIFLNLVVAKTN